MKKWDSFKNSRKFRNGILLCVALLILGIQAFIVLQPKKYIDDLKSWPFLKYPMFSQVKYPGENVIIRKLVLTKCSADLETMSISYYDLGLMRKRFNTLLGRIHISAELNSQVDSYALEKLSVLIYQRFSDNYCNASILYQEHLLSENGLQIGRHQWKKIYQWNYRDLIFQSDSLKLSYE